MRALLLIVLALLPTCCADRVVDEPQPDHLVLRVETSGGCAMLGPNCVRFDVFGDGSVAGYRVTLEGIEAVGTGSIDQDLVFDLHREVSTTDLGALHERLPPGECLGCVDGTDFTMSFLPADQPPVPIEFSSVEVELDRNEPVFAAAWRVYAAANSAVEIPVISR